MTERMEEVEVVCGRCNGTGNDPQIGSAGTNVPFKAAPCTTAYGGCGGSGSLSLSVAPGSHTAARLRLADAAEAKDKAERAWEALGRRLEDCPQAFAWSRAADEYDEALAALAALRTARGA